MEAPREEEAGNSRFGQVDHIFTIDLGRVTRLAKGPFP